MAANTAMSSVPTEQELRALYQQGEDAVVALLVGLYRRVEALDGWARVRSETPTLTALLILPAARSR